MIGDARGETDVDPDDLDDLYNNSFSQKEWQRVKATPQWQKLKEELLKPYDRQGRAWQELTATPEWQKLQEKTAEEHRAWKEELCRSLPQYQHHFRPKTSIDTLWPLRDALAKVDLKKLQIHSAPVPIKSIVPGKSPPPNQEVMVIGLADKITPRDMNEPVKIAKRGYEMRAPTAYLNIMCDDETDQILCQVDRYKFENLGKPVIERGRAGKAIYAIKGTVPDIVSPRMIKVCAIRYIGDLDPLHGI
jgi:hypothetical protein